MDIIRCPFTHINIQHDSAWFLPLTLISHQICQQTGWYGDCDLSVWCTELWGLTVAIGGTGYTMHQVLLTNGLDESQASTSVKCLIWYHKTNRKILQLLMNLLLTPQQGQMAGCDFTKKKLLSTNICPLLFTVMNKNFHYTSFSRISRLHDLAGRGWNITVKIGAGRSSCQTHKCPPLKAFSCQTTPKAAS